MSSQPGKPGIAPLIATNDDMPPRGIGFDDAPLDEEPELYDGFIQSPPPDDTLRDASGEPFIVDRGVLAGRDVPASDRYVRVSDNQELFGDLAQSLSRIRDEYAKDHNRRAYADVPQALELNAEAGATLSQIGDGIVRKSQLTVGLKQALIAFLALGGAYPGLVEFVQHAAKVLDELLKALGIAP